MKLPTSPLPADLSAAGAAVSSGIEPSALALGREVAKVLNIEIVPSAKGWSYDPEATGNRNLDHIPARAGFASRDEALTHIGVKAGDIVSDQLTRCTTERDYLPLIDLAHARATENVVRNDPNSTDDERNSVKEIRKEAEVAVMVADQARREANPPPRSAPGFRSRGP